jgi:hypothetical protein
MPLGHAVKDDYNNPLADFFTQVPLGAYPQMSLTILKASATDITSTTQTIWPVNSFYTFPTSETAANSMAIASQNAFDTTAGGGAQKIRVEGLDNNYCPVTEVVSMNGTTPVPLAGEFARINNMTTTQWGGFGVNLGIVSAGTGIFTTGAPAVAYSIMSALDNTSTTGVYTIPDSYTLLAYSPNVNIGRSWPLTGRIKFTSRLEGGGFITDFEIAGDPAMNRGRLFAKKYSARTDLHIISLAVGSLTNVSISQEMVLIQNKFFEG